MYLKGSAFPALWSRPSESHITWKTLHVSESHKPYAGLCLKEQTVLQLRVFVQLARRGRTELAKCKIPFSPCHHSTLPCQLFLRHSLSAISIKKQDTGKFHCWKADHILYSASRRPLQDLQRCFFHIWDIIKKSETTKQGGHLYHWWGQNNKPQPPVCRRWIAAAPQHTGVPVPARVRRLTGWHVCRGEGDSASVCVCVCVGKTT